MLVRRGKRVYMLDLGIHAWTLMSLFIKHVGLFKCEINYKHTKISTNRPLIHLKTSSELYKAHNPFF